jgi:hypothetical protein
MSSTSSTPASRRKLSAAASPTPAARANAWSGSSRASAAPASVEHLLHAPPPGSPADRVDDDCDDKRAAAEHAQQGEHPRSRQLADRQQGEHRGGEANGDDSELKRHADAGLAAHRADHGEY